MNTSSSPAPALSDEQQETLRALLALFVPASSERRLPAAGELPQVVQQVSEFAATLPGAREQLDRLQGFAALDEARRSEVLDQAGERDGAVLRRLALEAVTAYYQQDVVLERLGLEARPPFPKGYQILAGDLSLLNAVKARGRIWRDAGG